MRRVFYSLVISIAASSPVAAQSGRQIFDTIINGVDTELRRQQQRENQQQFFEQQRRAEQHRLQTILANHWNSCFSGDLFACDEALHSPSINESGRQRIRAQRQAIVVAAEQERERAQRMQREQAERERAAALERQRQQHDAWERVERDRRASQERERQTQAAEAARQQPVNAVQHTGSIPAQLSTVRAVSQASSVTMIQPTGYMIAILVLASALMATLALLFRDRMIAGLGTVRQMFSVTRADTTASNPPPSPSTSRASTAMDATPPANAHPAADPVTAVQALRLAYAYLEEVRQSIARDLDEPARLADHRSTLALAVR